MENKIIPLDQSFARYSRRVGIAEATLARPFEVIKGAEITVLFERGDKQNATIDQALAEKNGVLIASDTISPIVA